MMALIFVPFYAVTLVVSDPHSFIVQLFTYFPYSAPVTAMLRNGFGSLNPLESTIVIVELFALGIIVLRIAVRLFRYGSIEYSKKVSLKTVFARQRWTIQLLLLAQESKSIDRLARWEQLVLADRSIDAGDATFGDGGRAALVRIAHARR
jgi:hypothetical protein